MCMRVTWDVGQIGAIFYTYWQAQEQGLEAGLIWVTGGLSKKQSPLVYVRAECIVSWFDLSCSFHWLV